MRCFLLGQILLASLVAIAEAQPMTIEGQVRRGVEMGCWVLNDVHTGMSFEPSGGGSDLYQEGVRAVVTGIAHPDWVSICMQGISFEVLEYEIVGPWYWPPSECEIRPPQPIAEAPMTVTLGGQWPDSCAPNGSDVSVIGQTVYFDVIHNYPPDIFCLMVITPWSLAETLGPLSPGTYTVRATLYEGLVPAAGPTQTCTFTVVDCDTFAACMSGPGGGVPGGCQRVDLDDDEDVDLRDFMDYQCASATASTPQMESYSDSGCLPRSELRGGQYPYCGDDELELTVSPGTLHVVHRNATYNCCPDDIVVSLSVEGHVLSLAELEILTDPCRCLCCYDVEATIVDLLPGVYTVAFCWYDYELWAEQCHVEDILIP